MRQDYLFEAIALADTMDSVPERIKDQLESLQSSLMRPKNLTVMGPPKTGTHDVMAFLSGDELYNPDLPLGSVYLVYGPRNKTTFYFADNSSADMDDLPIEHVDFPRGAPVKTVIEAPVAALKKIVLTCLKDCRTLDEQINAMTAIVPYSDLVVWCTSEFNAVEQKLWGHLPEHIHHCAMILKTDVDSTKEQTSKVAAALAKRTRGDFAFANAIDLDTALVVQSTTPINRDEMKRCGGTSLISNVLREIHEGHESVLDQIEFILAKHSVPVNTDVSEAPAQDVPVSEPVAERAQELENDVQESASVEAEPANLTPAQKHVSQDSAGASALMKAVQSAKDNGVRDRDDFISREDDLDEFEQFWAASALSKVDESLRVEALKPRDADIPVSEICLGLSKRFCEIKEANVADAPDGFEVVEQYQRALTWFETALERAPDAKSQEIESMKRISADAKASLDDILNNEVYAQVAVQKATILSSNVSRNLSALTETVAA